MTRASQSEAANPIGVAIIEDDWRKREGLRTHIAGSAGFSMCDGYPAVVAFGTGSPPSCRNNETLSA